MCFSSPIQWGSFLFVYEIFSFRVCKEQVSTPIYNEGDCKLSVNNFEKSLFVGTFLAIGGRQFFEHFVNF